MGASLGGECELSLREGPQRPPGAGADALVRRCRSCGHGACGTGPEPCAHVACRSSDTGSWTPPTVLASRLLAAVVLAGERRSTSSDTQYSARWLGAFVSGRGGAEASPDRRSSEGAPDCHEDGVPSGMSATARALGPAPGPRGVPPGHYGSDVPRTEA